ncbi:hypothetical protein [Frateuria sp.]|uniref:hypothetical protein n=1 Tax=Frateuria sp. TaxID=2211372 RepID=UPI003F7E8D59
MAGSLTPPEVAAAANTSSSPAAFAVTPAGDAPTQAALAREGIALADPAALFD